MSHLWPWAPFPELRLCLGDRHLSHSAEGQGEIQTLHWSSQPMEVVEGPQPQGFGPSAFGAGLPYHTARGPCGGYSSGAPARGGRCKI